MNPRIEEVPEGTKFPGESGIRFNASGRQVRLGDIIEITWGDELNFNPGKGRTSKGLVIGACERLVDRNHFAAREFDITFREGWFEQTIRSGVHEGSVVLVPTTSKMNFENKFTLSTADMGDAAWRITVVGHDCSVHDDDECLSVYEQRRRDIEAA